MAHTNGTGETEEQRINRLARRVAARADANYAMSQRLLVAAENAEAMLLEIADRATGAGQHLDRVARSKDKRMRGCGQISLGPRAWRQYWADRSVAESKGMTYLGPIYQHNRFLGLAFMSAEGWLKPHGEFLDGGPLWHPESDAAIMLARGGRPHHPPLPPGPPKRLLQGCTDGNEHERPHQYGRLLADLVRRHHTTAATLSHIYAVTYIPYFIRSRSCYGVKSHPCWGGCTIAHECLGFDC